MFESAVVSSGNSYELILGFSKEITNLDEQHLAIYINNDTVGTRLDQKYYKVTKIANGSDKGKWSVTFETNH